MSFVIALSVPHQVSVSNCKVYIAPGLRETLVDFDAVIRKAKVIVTTVDDATAFIVHDVKEPSTAVLWNASLIGGVICTWQLLRLGFGPSRTFHAALSSRRLIYMTDNFLAESPRMASALADKICFPQSKWKLTNDVVFRWSCWKGENCCSWPLCKH